MDHDLAPSSTSWGSQVRVLYRPSWLDSPGITLGESNHDYHRSAGWSKSQLWDLIYRGPRYFYLRHLAGSIKAEESASLSHGTLLHRWLEVGDSLWGEIAVPPDSVLTETGQVGKAARSWAAEHAAGKQIVSSKESAQLRAEADAILAHESAANLIEEAVAREISVRWTSPDGVQLRCRPDLCTESVWVDLKTTSETDILGSWWKSVVKYGYHVQDALYQWGMESVGMEPHPLIFVVVSTTAPHECHAVTLPQELRREGRVRLDAALAELQTRQDVDYWRPDEHGAVVELPVPQYLLRRDWR